MWRHVVAQIHTRLDLGRLCAHNYLVIFALKSDMNLHISPLLLVYLLLFFKFLTDTCSFWGGGHWYPCFGFLVTSPLGFKARVDSALFDFCGGECIVHSLRSTSGATCADLLGAIAQPVTTPHACVKVGLGSDLNG